uniref:DUF3789 domain-containing protein n=1 Tax=Enterocloster clostridioformis TaxID=1531 RepID=UPI002F40235F
MWNILMHFLTFTGGVAAGVVLMCLLRAGKQADEEFEQLQRNSQRNERGNSAVTGLKINRME